VRNGVIDSNETLTIKVDISFVLMDIIGELIRAEV